VMVLQRLEGLSDREAVERYSFDARWRYAAGVGSYDCGGWASVATYRNLSELLTEICQVNWPGDGVQGMTLRGGTPFRRRSVGGHGNRHALGELREGDGLLAAGEHFTATGGPREGLTVWAVLLDGLWGLVHVARVGRRGPVGAWGWGAAVRGRGSLTAPPGVVGPGMRAAPLRSAGIEAGRARRAGSCAYAIVARRGADGPLGARRCAPGQGAAVGSVGAHEGLRLSLAVSRRPARPLSLSVRARCSRMR
jgi:hypothetical protein